MAAMKKTAPLPLIDGIKPSYLHLPCDKKLHGTLLLDFLCCRFPYIGREIWAGRLSDGHIFDEAGTPLAADAAFRPGGTVYYYREAIAAEEEPVPFQEHILHIDEHLIVADKPHFLPVIPGGRFLRETLLTRLRLRPELQHLNPENFTPLHRLDKDTAGVILFAHRPESRRAYQTLFQSRAVEKTYEALAPTRTDLAYPLHVRSRLERGEPFYLTRQAEGEANSHTIIELAENRGGHSLYRLRPVSGKKHQLRVHMAALGMPLLNDPLYPDPQPADCTDYARPLKLLARAIEFTDPFSGLKRRFESTRAL